MEGDRATLTESAPAKVNLTLRVLNRRGDGYHEIESLVVFAQVADRLSLIVGEPLVLELRGPHAAATGPVEENLVLKAARTLAAFVTGLTLGRFILAKDLPVAAGLGGGSADAAAALRLLARANGLASDDPRLLAAARRIGADVPVCLDPRPRLMRGIGEELSAPLPLPPLPAVLVNPGLPVATKEVFECFDRQAGRSHAGPLLENVPHERPQLYALLRRHRNDLEVPATTLEPAIAQVLLALQRLEGAHIVRMSGSGATCFALFDSARAAAVAARRLRATHPGWWVRNTTLR
jgi:4-diphosphocytidyl-2-C-methyl-D-erythritol kinase